MRNFLAHFCKATALSKIYLVTIKHSKVVLPTKFDYLYIALPYYLYGSANIYEGRHSTCTSHSHGISKTTCEAVTSSYIMQLAFNGYTKVQ